MTTYGYNTKEYTKKVYILDLDKINDIYKEVCDKTFYQHSSNSFKQNQGGRNFESWGEKDWCPQKHKKIDLTSEEFWYKYFEIANSEGHKKWIRSLG